MTEPTRYSTAPVELPLRFELEPTPVEGCTGCTDLSAARDHARVVCDMSTVTDCDVRMRQHPDGHQ